MVSIEQPHKVLTYEITETHHESIKTFADIKSIALLEILRAVLQDVKSISLRGKRPSVRPLK